MKIVTWNINGIRARIEVLLQWLREEKPEVVLLQEIKSVEETFPVSPLEDEGYNVYLHGQKGFNGVAFLSKKPLEDVVRGLSGDDSDEQARWIEATLVGSEKSVRLCNLYLPNGNPVPGEKYTYKLSWMERLYQRTRELLELEEPVLLAGDFNVIPSTIDAKDISRWTDDALYLPQSRAAFRKILNLGYMDAFRTLHPEQQNAFTFWDYTANAWEKDNGIRIDHVLLNSYATDIFKDCFIQKSVRAWEKPSDHVPVWCDLEIGH